MSDKMQGNEPWYEAVDNVVYQAQMLTGANRLDTAAHYLIELSNALGDLKTWMPGYDDRTGTLPWEREEV